MRCRSLANAASEEDAGQNDDRDTNFHRPLLSQIVVDHLITQSGAAHVANPFADVAESGGWRCDFFAGEFLEPRPHPRGPRARSRRTVDIFFSAVILGADGFRSSSSKARLRARRCLRVARLLSLRRRGTNGVTQVQPGCANRAAVGGNAPHPPPRPLVSGPCRPAGLDRTRRRPGGRAHLRRSLGEHAART